jgi:hypothetical protein
MVLGFLDWGRQRRLNTSRQSFARYRFLFLCRGLLFVGPERETLPIPTVIPTANYRTFAFTSLDRIDRISFAWEKK